MGSIKIDTKEFKKILKLSQEFSEHSHNQSSAVLIKGSPSPTFLMVTDHNQITVRPNSAVSQPSPDYVFNPTLLERCTFTNKQVELKYVDAKSPITILDGKLTTTLRASLNMQFEGELPAVPPQISIPIDVFMAVCRFSEIPCSYTKMNSDQIGINFEDNKGFLKIYTTDGYSMLQIETNIPTPGGFSICIPTYVIRCFANAIEVKNDTAPVSIGVDGYRVCLDHPQVSVIATAKADETVFDFDEIMAKQLNNITASCSFEPKAFLSNLKPLANLIPPKDKSGPFIVFEFRDDKGYLSLKHKDIGEAVHEGVDGITNLKFEKNLKACHTNLHVQAAVDYTGLLDGEPALMYLSGRAMYYEIKPKYGSHELKCKFMFPSVSL